MAAPNIVNVTGILGKTYGNALTTSNAILIINGNNSGNVIKVNSVVVTNIGASSTDASIEYNTAAAGTGSVTRIAYQIAVPTKSTLIVSDKSSAFYMEENTCLKGNASQNSSLEVLISYEIIT